MKAEIQFKDVKVNWKNSKCPFLAKSCWESMEKQLKSSGNVFPEFSSLQIFQNNSG